MNVVYLRAWICFANSYNLRETKLKLNPEEEMESWNICIYLYSSHQNIWNANFERNFRYVDPVNRIQSVISQNDQRNGLDKKNGYIKFRFSSTLKGKVKI